MPSKSETFSKKAGCGNIHITFIDGSETSQPRISITGGKAGTCLAAFTAAMGYCLTVAYQHGATVEEMAAAFENVYCPQSLAQAKGPASCPDAIAKVLKGYAKEDGAK